MFQKSWMDLNGTKRYEMRTYRSEPWNYMLEIFVVGEHVTPDV